ncbi:hypothetical protein [Ramlibacter alkalitolerans]|uniref:Uncharacterized protein n=1 Tax=Ramlibacter alkalitolerans TaxID=2039631 RepID=A0ABS1JJA6_9BURK|nr:hypothetical protein [Ramlibacter alkalitolerans]
MSITPIRDPLAGERVVGLSPGSATEAASDWRRRPHVFPGRALTAGALAQWQAWQSGHLATRGQDWTPGVVDGLEVQAQTPEGGSSADVEVQVARGLGLAATGEDLVLTRPLRCLLADVPVVAPPGFFVDGSGVEPGVEGDPPTLRERRIGAALGALPAAAQATLLPFGVLLLQPVTVDRSSMDPMDPCERSACDEGTPGDAAAFEDWRLADAARLLWYVWPGEWRGVPAVGDAQMRNALAWTVFQAEEALAESEVLPWEEWGLPLALVALDPATRRPLWLDRASVVRAGGRPRDARLANTGGALLASSRKPALWQARIEQLAEQVAAAGEPSPAASELRAGFSRFLPPVGLLPKAVYVPDLTAPRSEFFPVGFDLDAVPVPMEQLDLPVRANASLAPLSPGAAESVRLLVPVPLSSWEPRLLLRENVDPGFQEVLDENLLRRARTLGLRQGLRNRLSMLSHALDGREQQVPAFKDDPLAIDNESLSPWGPPPPGGGHRSALLAGVHQHFFDGADPPFTPQPGESLFVWACLDPDHPPRTLMLQWHGADGWEHRAFWGEDLIAWGAAATPAHHRAGNLPVPGKWVMLAVDAATVGLSQKTVDGMAFTLYDGRAAFGLAGARTPQTWRKWFCNFLPTGARVQGDESWDLLSANDLWSPFEPHDGVVPSLPEVQSGGGDPLGGEAQQEPETLAVPVSGFNLSYPVAAGWRGHSLSFAGRQVTIPRTKADRLVAWIYLDELTPPRSIWVGIPWTGLKPVGEDRLANFRIAFWGENRLQDLVKISSAFTEFNARTRHAGALPQSGVWVPLELPVPAPGERNPDTDIQAQSLTFIVFGGNMAFSDLLQVPQDQGLAQGTRLWPEGTPTGDTTTPPYLPQFGAKLVAQHNLGVLTPTPSSRIGTVKVYTELAADPLIQRLSGHEQSQLLLRGLSAFADYLRTRIDRADDITDFGFAHMQVDMHRIRQLTMSASDAGRLAVSPTLAALATADSAIVVQKQIEEYVSTVKKRALAMPAVVAPTPAPAAQPLRAGIAVSAVIGTAAKSTLTTTATRLNIARNVVAEATLIRPASAPPAIVFANPVVGLAEIRTTAIAERLRNPPSPEARNYALANRQRTVLSLLGLLEDFAREDSGAVPAVFADFQIPGLPGDPFLAGATGLKRPLTDLRGNQALQDALATPPPSDESTLDESTLFSQAVSLSDITVAILRQLEARLAIYRDALARCDGALAALRGDIDAMNGRLAQVGDALAEARHDVSVARALLAEETERIDGINARRARVLAEEVKFIAYVRPREIDNLLATPARAVDPGLVEPAVPACLREHLDAPEELLDMLRVVREAPANWFVRVPPLLQRLDKVDHLVRLIGSAQARAVTGLAAPQLAVSRATPVGKLATGIAQVAVRQAEALAPRFAALQVLDLQVLQAASWQGVRAEAEKVVSFGDLAEGAHGRADVARAAAAELDQIRGVSACLHAEFSGVLPVIRLQWAELLSEFDAAPNLRNLGSLPRWAEVAYLDRRQMQSYVDWLFAQVEPGQPQAVALVNDVVRMCLLLASHAPVDRILQGRLARPATGVSPGVRIPLTVLDPSRLRVGMQALLYRNDTLVARATVEDLGAQEVAARVVHTAQARVDLGDDVRVHFDTEAMVSLAAGSAQRTLFRR